MSCSAQQMNQNIRMYSDAFKATSSLIQIKVSETVEALEDIQSISLNQKLQVESFIFRINECEPSTEFDPDDVIHDALISIEARLRAFYAELKAGLQAAQNDLHLNGTNEIAIVTEYEHTMKAVSDHYEANEKLRLMIMEVDAGLSPVSELFDNAEDLIAELNS